VAGLEFDQNVDITVGPEVIAQDRAEEAQPLHMVFPAEDRDSLFVNRNG
jgi:hypothetical protein